MWVIYLNLTIFQASNIWWKTNEERRSNPWGKLLVELALLWIKKRGMQVEIPPQITHTQWKQRKQFYHFLIRLDVCQAVSAKSNEKTPHHLKRSMWGKRLMLCINTNWKKRNTKWKISPWESDGDGLQALSFGGYILFRILFSFSLNKISPIERGEILVA